MKTSPLFNYDELLRMQPQQDIPQTVGCVGKLRAGEGGVGTRAHIAVRSAVTSLGLDPGFSVY